MDSKRALFFLLAAAAVAVPYELASACAVPVFRYALERWEPDTFLVVVRHQETLNAHQRSLVETLRATADDTAKPANVQVVVLDELRADADGPATEPGNLLAEGEVRQAERRRWLDMLKKIDAPQLDPAAEAPQMLLLMPLPGRPPWPVWSGPLNAANCHRLIDSPLRQAIVKRILDGQSAVWVLLASGQEEADKRAEATLRKELARMEKTLQLPSAEALAMEPSYRPDSAVELRIGFSVVVLNKDDPAEAIFRAMVLASEPDLVDFNEPIAVPIFGRGRTYFALVGKGIHADMIEENCRFLCDGCSCVIKQENPGVDMLLAVNWDAQIDGSAIPDLVLPELTGIGVPPAAATVGVGGAETTVKTAAAATGSVLVAATADTPAEPVTAERSASTATATRTSVPPNRALPAKRDSFGRQLLVWTLAGIGLAVLLVGIGSLWISSQSSQQP